MAQLKSRLGRTGAPCLLLAMIGLITMAAAAPARAATPEQVEQAVRKAVAYLYSAQNGGNWELFPQKNPKGPRAGVSGHQWGGPTAIATYALLAAGESPQDKRLEQGVQFLMKALEMDGIYATGLRAQVWQFLPVTPQVREAIRRDYLIFMAAIYKQGVGRGMYPYYVDLAKGIPGEKDWFDHSVSQYGVLGMWALAQAGAEIPESYWREVDTAWRAHQNSDGGWGYRWKQGDEGQNKTKASMTAAGIATLFITQEFTRPNQGINCTGNIRDEDIEKGLKWMSENVKGFIRSNSYYTLYGLERIGVASGYKYFGTENWYEIGAESLVKAQNADGSWGRQKDKDRGERIPDTCFALLFLCRGRAPVVMNKLEYELDTAGDKPILANWNQRPRDAANVSRWIGRQLERDLNWQVVNLKVNVSDLHDAPILYIAGNQTLAFTADEKQKLKTYIEQGGMILGNSDCGSAQFAESFRKLGQELFPAYEFRPLPENHPILVGQQFNKASWKSTPDILALSNGARELMLLFPNADPSRNWQTRSIGAKEELHQIAANLFLYAIDKSDLRVKGQTYIVAPNPKIKPGPTLKVARIEYPGNWNPEPGGWHRLAAVLLNDKQIKLEVEPVKPGLGKLAGHRVAHLTGTTQFKLSPGERDEIRGFVRGGGTLIIDAAAGSSEFAQAAEAELSAILGAEAKLNILPADHMIFGDGENRIPVAYRDFARKTLFGQLSAPRLRGLTTGGERVSVFYSPEDITVGLVGMPIDGIVGYTPAVATQLIENMLIYAMTDGKSVESAKPVPATQKKDDGKKDDGKKDDAKKGDAKKDDKKPAAGADVKKAGPAKVEHLSKSKDKNPELKK